MTARDAGSWGKREVHTLHRSLCDPYARIIQSWDDHRRRSVDDPFSYIGLWAGYVMITLGLLPLAVPVYLTLVAVHHKMVHFQFGEVKKKLVSLCNQQQAIPFFPGI